MCQWLAADSKMLDYEVTPEDVKAKLDAGETFTLLDVREPWEFATAMIDGAQQMPMGEVPARAHQELKRDQTLVVYCHHGVRSLRVAYWLRQQGFEKAQSMSGGIDAWSKLVDARVPLY